MYFITIHNAISYTAHIGYYYIDNEMNPLTLQLLIFKHTLN